MFSRQDLTLPPHTIPDRRFPENVKILFTLPCGDHLPSCPAPAQPSARLSPKLVPGYASRPGASEAAGEAARRQSWFAREGARPGPGLRVCRRTVLHCGLQCKEWKLIIVIHPSGKRKSWRCDALRCKRLDMIRFQQMCQSVAIGQTPHWRNFRKESAL